ncbi:alpha/beta fold hydrolase [Novosphingobium sp. 9]|uniref:alpha/beta fold hydrolase n=1 Tax=Novosphingobium sp. 9 TaxID=2025349 RepID=UPI0021B5ABF9|nr:alpha/beta hydrolase [Novosphingobium sp. 9]
MIRPTLVLLHALGSSACEWDDVIAALGTQADCLALDLPGFGARAAATGFDTITMVEEIADTIREQITGPWMIVGHSMGGKLATLLAARAQSGEMGLTQLSGVVLVSASPPSPEPIDEARRESMLAWVADGSIDVENARTFVSDNTASPLSSSRRDRAERDVMRSSPFAWRAWLERGCREDWSAALEPLDCPALILAGSEDGDLGTDAQLRLNLPHYVRGAVETIAGTAHLAPYEKPEELAQRIIGHWTRCAPYILPPETGTLIASSRTSTRTRRVHYQRRWAPTSPPPFSERQMETLETLVNLILPGIATEMELPQRVAKALGEGQGDGWRFADLPPDREAWSIALDGLSDLVGSSTQARQTWLQAMSEGRKRLGSWSPDQARHWFQDACALIAQTWIAHPSTMARIGYDGFATGADGDRLVGYHLTGADKREPWQSPFPQGVA